MVEVCFVEFVGCCLLFLYVFLVRGDLCLMIPLSPEVGSPINTYPERKVNVM